MQRIDTRLMATQSSAGGNNTTKYSIACQCDVLLLWKRGRSTHQTHATKLSTNRLGNQFFSKNSDWPPPHGQASDGGVVADVQLGGPLDAPYANWMRASSSAATYCAQTRCNFKWVPSSVSKDVCTATHTPSVDACSAYNWGK